MFWVRCQGSIKYRNQSQIAHTYNPNRFNDTLGSKVKLDYKGRSVISIQMIHLFLENFKEISIQMVQFTSENFKEMLR